MPSREQLSALIDAVLNGAEHKPIHWSNKPLLEGPPGQVVNESSDPIMSLAIALMKARYPNATNRVQKFNLQNNPDEGGSIYGRNINLSPTRAYPDLEKPGDLTDALDVLRHELSHVMGADDNRMMDFGLPVSAYDISDASHLLHQDINLPSETKKRQQ